MADFHDARASAVASLRRYFLQYPESEIGEDRPEHLMMFLEQSLSFSEWHEARKVKNGG